MKFGAIENKPTANEELWWTIRQERRIHRIVYGPSSEFIITIKGGCRRAEKKSLSADDDEGCQTGVGRIRGRAGADHE